MHLLQHLQQNLHNSIIKNSVGIRVRITRLSHKVTLCKIQSFCVTADEWKRTLPDYWLFYFTIQRRKDLLSAKHFAFFFHLNLGILEQFQIKAAGNTKTKQINLCYKISYEFYHRYILIWVGFYFFFHCLINITLLCSQILYIRLLIKKIKLNIKTAAADINTDAFN